MPQLSDFWRKFRTEHAMMEVPFRTQTGVGMLPATLSQANSQGFSQNFDNQGGNNRIAKYKYKQRRLRDGIKNVAAHGQPNYCAADEAPVYLEADQEITQRHYKQFRIPESDIRNYEENQAQVLQAEIAANVNALLEELNAALIAQYIAKKGDFFGGVSTPKSLQGFSNLATYTINHAFELGINNEFRALQLRGQKIIVGDTMVNSYYRTLARGDVNTERGQITNQTLMNDYMFYDDTMLDAEVGTSNNALVWSPGSFQMLEWMRFVGEYRIVKDTVIKDTITLNIGGIAMRFDIAMKEDFCTDATSGLVVTISKEWDCWTFPSDIFSPNDPLNGTNGMLHFVMTGG